MVRANVRDHDYHQSLEFMESSQSASALDSDGNRRYLAAVLIVVPQSPRDPGNMYLPISRDH